MSGVRTDPVRIDPARIDPARIDLKDIKDEIGEFILFSPAYLSDHEKRMSAPEEKNRFR